MFLKLFFTILAAFAFFTTGYAEMPSTPVGTWIAVSDKTHDRTGKIQIFKQNGKLYGKITTIFPGPARSPKDRCDKCPGDFKNKPVMGLTFLWDFVPQGNGRWADGQILDAKEGKIYRASLTLADHGNKLNVRGYWGIFWRTQTWVRADLTRTTV